MKTVLERFLSYAKMNTQSEEECEQVPSTERQWVLANYLAEELKEIHASEVRISENCYVYATIPATTEEKLPVIGLIAHMDTSDAVTGEGVNPRVVKNYDGGDIILNRAENIILSPEQFPQLAHVIGEDLVVTDGNTLLGADDKAGIAEIMTAAQYLLAHPEIPHGTIRIGFTPDEEVGRGADFFDVEGFAADFAYTVDGGELGEIEYENFNAAAGKVLIRGVSVHPGSAKNQMINASEVGMEFHRLLPAHETPAHTEGYEGFYHLTEMSGKTEEAVMNYILRDFDAEKLEEKKTHFLRAAEYLNEVYGAGTVTATVKDSYRNMKEIIETQMEVVERMKRAMQTLSVEPKIIPIRGGTDGARLSFMGLPCPNLCTGGSNFHGKYEYVSIQAMETIVKILIEIVKKQ